MSKNKKIKIVSGNGKNIKISDVKEHLNIESPDEDVNPKEIIVPKVKKEKK